MCVWGKVAHGGVGMEMKKNAGAADRLCYLAAPGTAPLSAAVVLGWERRVAMVPSVVCVVVGNGKMGNGEVKEVGGGGVTWGY